jgi:hypothetical protein
MPGLKVIPHNQQRYNTIGDWFYYYNDELQVRVSSLNDVQMEQCIALHEIIEAHICYSMGVTEEMVDKFDLTYPPMAENEPGDDPMAPYYRAHQVASACERMIAYAIGVPWDIYEARCADVLATWIERPE